MKFFLVGELDVRLTGNRLFVQAVDEQQARVKFYARHPAMQNRPRWLVAVKEISETDFVEKRA